MKILKQMPLTMTYESCSVRLSALPNGSLLVGGLYSGKQRQGHARELMRRVCEYADEYEHELLLYVGQFGVTTGMDNRQLADFYSSFGFVRTKEQPTEKMRMMRPAHNRHTLEG